MRKCQVLLWIPLLGLGGLAGLISCQGTPAPSAPVDGAPEAPPPTTPPPPPPVLPPPTVRVEMTRADRFLPDVVVIHPGDTVEWTNNSDRLHSVTNDPVSALQSANVSSPPSAAPFDSGYLEPGKTFRYRFTQEGEYRYVSFLHEAQGMRGRVLVVPRGGP